MALYNAKFVEAEAKDNDLYLAVLYGIGNSTDYYLDAGWGTLFWLLSG